MLHHFFPVATFFLSKKRSFAARYPNGKTSKVGSGDAGVCGKKPVVFLRRFYHISLKFESQECVHFRFVILECVH